MRVQLPGTTLAPRICTICGKQFLGGPSARFCPECRQEKQKEYARAYKRRKRAGKSIVMGVTKGKCARCGKEFVYQSGLQKYCPDCAEEAMREVDRKTGRGWLRRAADKYGQQYINDRNRERRVYSHDNCHECGAPLPPGHGPTTLYCDACLKLHASYRAYRTRAVSSGREAVSYKNWKSSRFCAICGKHLDSARSRFCPDCRKVYKRYREFRNYRINSGLPEITLDEYLKGRKNENQS